MRPSTVGPSLDSFEAMRSYESSLLELYESTIDSSSWFMCLTAD